MSEPRTKSELEAFEKGWSAAVYASRGDRAGQRRRRVASGKAKAWVRPDV